MKYIPNRQKSFLMPERVLFLRFLRTSGSFGEEALNLMKIPGASLFQAKSGSSVMLKTMRISPSLLLSAAEIFTRYTPQATVCGQVCGPFTLKKFCTCLMILPSLKLRRRRAETVSLSGSGTAVKSCRLRDSSDSGNISDRPEIITLIRYPFRDIKTQKPAEKN